MKNLNQLRSSIADLREKFYQGVFLLVLMLSAPVSAMELRIVSKADILSLDPHGLAESSQLDVLGNLYEPLVSRDRNGHIVPALALAWQQTDALHWRFKLRQGVEFHHGEKFSADDVIYSFERANQEQSGVRQFVAAIQQVRKIADDQLEFVLKQPLDDFPGSLIYWYQISRHWCSTHACEWQQVADASGRGSSIADQVNGTGPYRLQQRQAGAESQFIRNPRYWRSTQTLAERVQWRIVADDAKRAQLLMENQADVVMFYPNSALAQLQSRQDLAIFPQAEARVLFLGFDLSHAQINTQRGVIRNPWLDKRVRQAVYHAIDSAAIQRDILAGYAKQLGILVPPGVLGYDAQLDERLSYDKARAKALLSQAGYSAGFSVSLNCPNDRYVNDAAICKAIVKNLREVGIQVDAEIETKTQFFKKVFARASHFYLLGAATNSGDAYHLLYPLLGSVREDGRGEINFAGYSNTQIDLLLQQLTDTHDKAQRQGLIRQILRYAQDDLPYIPLHQQIALTAAKSSLKLYFTAENGLPWQFIESQENRASSGL